MLFKIAPLALLATSVIADGASILAVLNQLSNDTLALNTTVANWEGDLLGLIPILSATNTLSTDIQDGTTTASNSANLTTAELLTIVVPTETLVSDVESSLQSIIDAKQKFADLLIAPVIYLTLSSLKSETDKFSAAVISKVPAAFQSLAEGIVAPIDVYFEYALGNYTGAL